MNRRHHYAASSHDIRIGGRRVNVYLARIVYRCRECLGELKLYNNGLCCISDPNHHGFIHRDNAAKIKAEEEKLLNKMSDVYEIIDGQIISRR